MNKLVEAKTSFNQSIFVKLFLRHSTIQNISIGCLLVVVAWLIRGSNSIRNNRAATQFTVIDLSRTKIFSKETTALFIRGKYIWKI